MENGAFFKYMIFQRHQKALFWSKGLKEAFLHICFNFQLWDSRKKGVLQTFQNTYQVTAVTFSDTAEQVLSGGIDNDIKVCTFKY